MNLYGYRDILYENDRTIDMKYMDKKLSRREYIAATAAMAAGFALPRIGAGRSGL